MPNLPPINQNQAIVDAATGRPKSAFVLLINQLIGSVVAAASATAASVQASLTAFLGTKPTGTAPIVVTGTYDPATGVTISLADSPLAPSTYGDATHYPKFTTDAKGRVIAVSLQAVGGSISVGDGTTTVNPASILKFTGATVTAGAAPGEADIAIAGGGGGGGGGNLIKLAQIVTSGGETSISFDGISQNYDDLVLNCAGATAGSGAGTFFQCNHDGGANYAYYRSNHYGNSNSNSSNNMDLVSMGADALDGEVTFSDYTGTAAKKIVRALSAWGGPADNFPQIASGEWRSTAPITSLQVLLTGASFPAGTVFTLYGRGGTIGGGGGGGGGKGGGWAFSGFGVPNWTAVTATATGAFVGDPNGAIGLIPANNFYWGSGSGQTITFDFAASVTIAGIGTQQDVATSQGNWQASYSDDNVTFTNVGAPGNLGNAAKSAIVFGASGAHRYWRLTQVSGSTSSHPYVQQYIFLWA